MLAYLKVRSIHPQEWSGPDQTQIRSGGAEGTSQQRHPSKAVFRSQHLVRSIDHRKSQGHWGGNHQDVGKVVQLGISALHQDSQRRPCEANTSTGRRTPDYQRNPQSCCSQTTRLAWVTDWWGFLYVSGCQITEQP